MLSLKIKCDVPKDRGLHIQLPLEIQPGKHEIVLVVDIVPNTRDFSIDKDIESLTVLPSQSPQPSNSAQSFPKLNPAEIFLASGFIGCGETDPLLSENYKDKLIDSLREKHGDR